MISFFESSMTNITSCRILNFSSYNMCAEMQDMTLHSQHPDKWCEDPDDHRPFTTITLQLMMTNNHDQDDDYEIEEEKSEEEE